MLSTGEAEAELLQCCGSASWARRMAQQRPFAGWNEIREAADRIWWGLGRVDWLEAFSRHPGIGESAATSATSDRARGWSEREQAGLRDAGVEVKTALAEANRGYLARFGYIFIVCATGKSSEEMLALLRSRLQNDPGAELRIAAEEQRRITHLRLEKLLRG
jgi:OHCU decarboxylase